MLANSVNKVPDFSSPNFDPGSAPADGLAIDVFAIPLILLTRRCLRRIVNLITGFKSIKVTVWLCVAFRGIVLPLELAFAPARSCELATEPKHV